MKRTVFFLFLGVIALSLSAGDKTRIFVTDTESWEISGGFGAGANGGGGGASGGARPQRVEVIKTFSKKCPEVTVTINREKADYIVLLDHEGGKSILSKDNKVAVFNPDGDLIHSASTRSLGNAVKGACKMIRQDLSEAAQELAAD